MNSLTHEQQQLIFEFYFRCGEQKDIDAGRDLVAADPRAEEYYYRLKNALTDLDAVKYEDCPNNLVEMTLARLKLASLADRSNNTDIDQLLEKQRQHIFTESKIRQKSRLELLRTHYFRPVFETLTAAAAILVAAGILFPSFGLMRQHSQQVACSRNLGQMGSAFASVFNDNGGNMPEAKVKTGDPWWKIGYNGAQTQSNTRYVWQLVKQGYVPAEAFVCQGRNGAMPVSLTRQQMAGLNDFPSRCNVSYSFVIFNDSTFRPEQGSRHVWAGDLNPVFEKIPCQQSIYSKLNEFEKVMLNEQLRKSMSGNHAGHGQNILHSDGSVRFMRTRLVGDDDIFTVTGVNSYTGRETPSNSRDIFLAP